MQGRSVINKRAMNISDIVRYLGASFFKVALSGLLCISPLWASELVKTIEYSKPSIVGVGTFQKTRSPPLNFLGTGFVLDDGLHVITNAHVVPEVRDVVCCGKFALYSLHLGSFISRCLPSGEFSCCNPLKLALSLIYGAIGH